MKIYFGDRNLKHKILAIVEEEGARHAAYALKLLQSEGKLTIASTGKDNATGQMVTKEYHVEGPVMIFTTSTAIDIDEELLNRCLILTVDESREQTRAIHREQRKSETLEGLVKKIEKKDMLKVLRNSQRLLKPLEVVNPYATELTFLDDHTRTRRDHKKYLPLIRTIAYLHQYQRPVKVLVHQGQTVNYIEASLDDIAIANELANDVLGRSLDELPPQTRRFLNLMTEMVRSECEQKRIEPFDYRFTQRDVRSFTGWSDYQVKSHIRKLVGLEYVLIHKGGRGQSFVYELLYNGEGQDGQKFVMGLIDVAELHRKCRYDDKREHVQPEGVQKDEGKEAKGSIEGGALAHGRNMSKTEDIFKDNNKITGILPQSTENAYIGAFIKTPESYFNPNHTFPSSLAAKD